MKFFAIIFLFAACYPLVKKTEWEDHYYKTKLMNGTIECCMWPQCHYGGCTLRCTTKTIQNASNYEQNFETCYKVFCNQNVCKEIK